MGVAVATLDAPLTFPQRLKGRFNGLVRLADAWTLAAGVVAYEGWYLLDPSKPAEIKEVSGSEVGCHLEELLEEILREEKGVWSTLVYVQDIQDPQIIKVYHPRRAGCGCGGQGGILPWWVLTRIKPEPVPEWEQASAELNRPEKRGGFPWLKKLF